MEGHDSPAKKDHDYIKMGDNGHGGLGDAINMSAQKQMISSENDFVCITCHRGPPYTRKYAKNQCQTCYKKTKKY